MAASRNDRPCVRASKRVRRCCFFSFAPLSHPPFLPTFIRACIYKRARFYTYKYTELASLLANTRLLLVLTYAISLLFPLIIFLFFIHKIQYHPLFSFTFALQLFFSRGLSFSLHTNSMISCTSIIYIYI